MIKKNARNTSYGVIIFIGFHAYVFFSYLQTCPGRVLKMCTYAEYVFSYFLVVSSRYKQRCCCFKSAGRVHSTRVDQLFSICTSIFPSCWYSICLHPSRLLCADTATQMFPGNTTCPSHICLHFNYTFLLIRGLNWPVSSTPNRISCGPDRLPQICWFQKKTSKYKRGKIFISMLNYLRETFSWCKQLTAGSLAQRGCGCLKVPRTMSGSSGDLARPPAAAEAVPWHVLCHICHHSTFCMLWACISQWYWHYFCGSHGSQEMQCCVLSCHTMGTPLPKSYTDKVMQAKSMSAMQRYG